MATIVKKNIKGHIYYYVVQTGWVDGKSRVVWQKYLGKAEDIVAKLEGAGAEPHMARVFSSGAVAALYQVATELAGECQDVTLILDKGNNSKKNILRLSDAMGFVGSLVPSHHPELLAVLKTEFVPMEGSQFGGVLAYRTKKEVFGAMRTVVAMYAYSNSRSGGDAPASQLVTGVQGRKPLWYLGSRFCLFAN